MVPFRKVSELILSLYFCKTYKWKTNICWKLLETETWFLLSRACSALSKFSLTRRFCHSWAWGSNFLFSLNAMKCSECWYWNLGCSLVTDIYSTSHPPPSALLQHWGATESTSGFENIRHWLPVYYYLHVLLHVFSRKCVPAPAFTGFYL